MDNNISVVYFWKYMHYIICHNRDLSIEIHTHDGNNFYDADNKKIYISRYNLKSVVLLHEFCHYLLVTKYNYHILSDNIRAEYLCEFFAYYTLGYNDKRSHKYASTYVHKYRKRYKETDISQQKMVFIKEHLRIEFDKIKKAQIW